MMKLHRAFRLVQVLDGLGRVDHVMEVYTTPIGLRLCRRFGSVSCTLTWAEMRKALKAHDRRRAKAVAAREAYLRRRKAR